MRAPLLSLLLAAFLLGPGMTRVVHAADISMAPVAPAARTLQVGKLDLTVLHDGEIIVPNDGKTFGTDAKPGEVADVLSAAGATSSKITLSVNVLLVRTSGHIALLDTGIGPAGHGALLASLQLIGVAPAAITDVLLTHSHADHSGGLLNAQGQIAFPNATIRMAGAEWAWFQKQAPAKVASVIGRHVQTFIPGGTVIPGIRSRTLAGHTPGHVAYDISSDEAHLLDIGDLAHSAIVSLAKPQWTMGFDSAQSTAKATRMNTLAALAHGHTLIYAPHFPFPGVGHIVAAGEGFKWVPTL